MWLLQVPCVSQELGGTRALSRDCCECTLSLHSSKQRCEKDPLSPLCIKKTKALRGDRSYPKPHNLG